MSLGSAFSTLSLSLSRAPSVKKTVAIASPSIPLSPGSSATSLAVKSKAYRTMSLPKDSGKEKNGLASISFSLSLDQDLKQSPKNENDCPINSPKMASLIINIHDAKNLPPRDYFPTRDSFIQVQVLKDRRSLRKKSKQCLAEFNTKTIKYQLNPEFHQAFSADLALADIKNIRVKLAAMDYDRHTKISSLGSMSIQLKDVKSLFHGKEPTRITNFLPQKREEFGEIMFGLSYLPTAQRVSFSILKTANLKFDKIVDTVEKFHPFVRIVQFNLSGKVVKKRKTGTLEGTKEPVFNETLNFNLPPNQLDEVSFVILVSHKRQSFSEDETNIFQADTLGVSVDRGSELLAPGPTRSRSRSPVSPRPSSPCSREYCLGKVCIGAKVRGEREKSQWLSVVANPRKVFTQWQTLY